MIRLDDLSLKTSSKSYEEDILTSCKLIEPIIVKWSEERLEVITKVEEPP